MNTKVGATISIDNEALVEVRTLCTVNGFQGMRDAALAIFSRAGSGIFVKVEDLLPPSYGGMSFKEQQAAVAAAKRNATIINNALSGAGSQSLMATILEGCGQKAITDIEGWYDFMQYILGQC